MTDAPVTRWWWVRHAPVPNPDGRIYGARDVQCDTSDTAAFTALAATLPAGAVWLTSNLSRTRETAAAIAAAGLSGPEPVAEPDLDEQDFGQWQGTTWAEFHAAADPVRQAFWRAPARTAPPGGESFADLMARVGPAVHRLTEAHAGRDIVAVTHGGTIRAALALALGLDPEHALAVVVDTLSLTRIDHMAGGFLHGRGEAWRVAGVNMPCR